MLEYNITARRIDDHGSVVRCKDAELIIDTDLKGRADALNPAELLLAAVAACIHEKHGTHCAHDPVRLSKCHG